MKGKKYFIIMYLFKNGLKDVRDHYIKLKNKSAPIWGFYTLKEAYQKYKINGES